MKQLILKKAYYLFVFLGITLLFSCSKEQNSVIPSVPFSFTINLNIANELTVPGNSMFFPGVAFGGVIVYCETPGNYYAFDATCTHEVSQSCKVENEGVLGTCSCCNSQFILIGGAYPSQGPAIAPLRQYHVSVVNHFTIRVYN